MNLFKRSITLFVFLFFSFSVFADPTEIDCQNCGNTSNLMDYGNHAINQVYGPFSWVSYDNADSFLVSNSQGQEVFVDLNLDMGDGLVTSIITGIISLVLEEDVAIGFPVGIQAIVTNVDGTTTTYTVSFDALDTLGPLNVGGVVGESSQTSDSGDSGNGGNSGNGGSSSGDSGAGGPTGPGSGIGSFVGSGGSFSPGSTGPAGEGSEPPPPYESTCTAGETACFVLPE